MPLRQWRRIVERGRIVPSTLDTDPNLHRQLVSPTDRNQTLTCWSPPLAIALEDHGDNRRTPCADHDGGRFLQWNAEAIEGGPARRSDRTSIHQPVKAYSLESTVSFGFGSRDYIGAAWISVLRCLSRDLGIFFQAGHYVLFRCRSRKRSKLSSLHIHLKPRSLARLSTHQVFSGCDEASTVDTAILSYPKGSARLYTGRTAGGWIPRFKNRKLNECQLDEAVRTS